jgi:uncharacterized protein
MAEQENIALAQQGYNNLKTGNIAALIEQTTEDIVWQLPEIEGVPLVGPQRGRERIADFIAQMEARDPGVIGIEPREFRADDDKVMVIGHYQWRVKETGHKFDSDFVHIFTIRDGKFAGFLEHDVTAVVVAAYKKAMARDL